MGRGFLLLLCFCFGSLLALRGQEELSVTTVIEGLYHPVGMALLPDGSVLVAEMGSMEVDTRLGFHRDSAGVSLLRPDGVARRLVSGFPSGRDPSDMLGALALGLSPDEQTVYIGHHGSQGLFTLPVESALDPPSGSYGLEDLGRAMAGQRGVFLLHPYDIAFGEDGGLLVTDSLANSVVGVGVDGERVTAHRFGALDDPRGTGGKLEAVPRGIARYGDEYLVALFSGCPHPANGGELVAVNELGEQRTVVDNLNMPIDVAVDAAGNIWLLEFAVAAADGDCFSAADFLGRSGRLSRLGADGKLETVVAGLDFPGAVLPLDDGGLYVTEVYAGRVVRVNFDGAGPVVRRYSSVSAEEPEYVEIGDVDAALREVIKTESLSAYPGREQIEGDTALARLGRDLFFDAILSGDKNISCATCHHPEHAMADGRALSIGAGGEGLGEGRVFGADVTVSGDTRLGLRGVMANPFAGEFIPRNSPTVINAVIAGSQFWDGRVEHAGEGGWVDAPDESVSELMLSDTAVAQAMLPIVSRLEMAGATFADEPPAVIREKLSERLRGIPGYVAQFEAAFGSGEIGPLRIAEAIAAFERQLIFTAAPWDDYVAGDMDALDGRQKRGALLFFGALNPEVKCAACHSGDLFTDGKHYNLLAPRVGTGKLNGPEGRDDFGRANVTFDHRDMYKFRSPSLRNVELTGPYFHSGAYAALEDVIWHHADVWGGNMRYEAAEQLPASMRGSYFRHDFARQGHSVAEELEGGLPMSEEDVIDLVAFLMALTDPAVRDLSHLVPESVPSGLPLD